LDIEGIELEGVEVEYGSVGEILESVAKEIANYYGV
jgi:hypothetical protein